MDALLTNVVWSEIGWASWDTLVMVGLSLLFSVLIGLPTGVVLFLTGKRQLLEQPVAYAVLSFVVNVLRSVPFIILLIVMIPGWWKPPCGRWTGALLRRPRPWAPMFARL